MEGYRRKWERKEGMGEDVVKLWKRTDESVCMNGMEEMRGFTYGSSLGRYVFGSEISYNKAPPRLPGLGC